MIGIAYIRLYMIGANGSVRGKKEFEPNSLAPESEPLLGPHLEDYWSIEDYWARSGGLLGWLAPSTSGGVFPNVGRVPSKRRSPRADQGVGV